MRLLYDGQFRVRIRDRKVGVRCILATVQEQGPIFDISGLYWAINKIYF